MVDNNALPPWAQQALAVPGQSHHVTVDGARIHYLGWNLEETDKPGLLLVHGFGAHARWWDFIAPQLTDTYRVAAVDLSGMGDSEYRESYDQGQYAREISAVISAAGLGPALLVSHSFGGLMSIRCCYDFPEQVRAAVIVDSRINFPLSGDLGERGAAVQRPKRVYPDYETARGRFRLIPEENSAPDFVFDHVARYSLREVEGGWAWKFDDRITATLPHPPLSEAEMLEAIDLPMALIYGEHSAVLPADVAAKTVSYMRNAPPPIQVDDAYHHVLLDQPQALTALLRELLPTL